MTGFTGGDNFGFTDFSGNSPSSNGPSSGGSSGGYSGGGGGYGTAGDQEARARGGRTVVAPPMSAPQAPSSFNNGIVQGRVRQGAPAVSGFNGRPPARSHRPPEPPRAARSA